MSELGAADEVVPGRLRVERPSGFCDEDGSFADSEIVWKAEVDDELLRVCRVEEGTEAGADDEGVGAAS